MPPSDKLFTAYPGGEGAASNPHPGGEGAAGNPYPGGEAAAGLRAQALAGAPRR